MNKSFLIAPVLLAALALPAVAKPGNGNGGGPKPKPTPVAKGRPGAAKAEMALPTVVEPAVVPDADARGRVDVKRFPAVGKRAAREWLRFKAQNLDPATTYEIWMDNPLTGTDDAASGDVDEAFVLELVGTLAVDDDGDAWGVRFDSHKGGLLPFGTAEVPTKLADFEGDAFEIRASIDTTDDQVDNPVLTTILTGTVPTIGPKR